MKRQSSLCSLCPGGPWAHHLLHLQNGVTILLRCWENKYTPYQHELWELCTHSNNPVPTSGGSTQKYRHLLHHDLKHTAKECGPEAPKLPKKPWSLEMLSLHLAPTTGGSWCTHLPREGRSSQTDFHRLLLFCSNIPNISKIPKASCAMSNIPCFLATWWFMLLSAYNHFRIGFTDLSGRLNNAGAIAREFAEFYSLFHLGNPSASHQGQKNLPTS